MLCPSHFVICYRSCRPKKVIINGNLNVFLRRTPVASSRLIINELTHAIMFAIIVIDRFLSSRFSDWKILTLPLIDQQGQFLFDRSFCCLSLFGTLSVSVHPCGVALLSYRTFRPRRPCYSGGLQNERPWLALV